MFRHLLAAVSIVALEALPLAVHAVPAGTDQDILERIKPVGHLCMQGGNCAGKMGSMMTAPAETTPATATTPSEETSATTTPAESVTQAPAASARNGEYVYSHYCFACHAAGVGGAPVFGNAEQWAPRIAKGMDALLQSAENGIPPLMPAKGTCMDCSDEELQAAVAYMVDAAKK